MKDSEDVSMTLNDGGKFSCQLSNIGNALFRKGKNFDMTKTYSKELASSCSFLPATLFFTDSYLFNVIF
mgnify:CR=1 FL=1